MTRMCAKWCGRGCTKEEHDAALYRAKLTALALGPGWKPRVWEKMWWRIAATAEEVWATRSCGQHSGIPECCIWAFLHGPIFYVAGKHYCVCARCVEIGFGYRNWPLDRCDGHAFQFQRTLFPAPWLAYEFTKRGIWQSWI